jgi:flagellar biosynthesis regulator FlaF
MQNSMRHAALAYAASAARRSSREQEADVFRYANAMLRRAQSDVAQTRALADNRRLWSTVIDLMKDPTNALPVELRASIVSVGLSVQREMERSRPDVDFLIAVNEDIAAGLAS